MRRYIEKMTWMSRARGNVLIGRQGSQRSGWVRPGTGLIGGAVSRSATRGPTSSCWPRSMRRDVETRARPGDTDSGTRASALR